MDFKFDFQPDTPEYIQYAGRRLCSNLSKPSDRISPTRLDYIMDDLHIFFNSETVYQCHKDPHFEKLRLTVIPELAKAQGIAKIISALETYDIRVNKPAASGSSHTAAPHAAHP